MRFGRIAILASIGIVVLVLVSLLLKNAWERQLQEPVDGTRLVAAARAFCRDQIAGGQPLPESVTLRELVNLRYLRADDVRSLEGIDLKFLTQVDPKHPRSVVARARLADGTEMLLLGDGSVQQTGK